jgi:regulator of sigma E protease
MSEFVLAVISFIVVLGPIIIIHELGHFIACRLVGVTVLEFGIGLPPRALKLFERNGTEFTLNWLPVGGFVRPLGEDFVRPVSPESSEKDRISYAAYQAELEALGRKTNKIKGMMEASPVQRLLFLFAGSGFNFLAAIVILAVAALLGVPGPAPIVGASAPDSPTATLETPLQFGDVIIAVNGQPVTTAEEIDAALEAGRDGAATITIERDGETREVTFDPTTRRLRAQGVMVVAVSADSPADGVFEIGDLITAVGETSISTTETLQEQVRELAGQSTSVTLVRNGEEQVVEITPRTDPPSGQGPVGISLQQLTFNPTYGLAAVDTLNGKMQKMAFGEAVRYGLSQTGSILRQLLEFPVQLVRGLITIQEARPVSIVGITQIGGEALSRTLEDRQPHWILNFAALISIALGFTNLLPIPGLDGGRILFVLVEIVRGKPMAPEREGMIHLVGLMIILGLFAILVINDIVNPIGPLLR